MVTRQAPTPVPAPPPKPPQLTLIGASLRFPTEGGGEGADDTGRRWESGYQYLPENHWPAEVRDTCDGTTLDLPALSAPTPVGAVANPSGGTLAAGLKTYEVTATDANGETTGSAAVTCTTVLNGTATVTWEPDDQAAAYNVYGRIGGSLGLIGQGITGTSFTDTGSTSPGSPVPSSNTTGGPGSYGNLGIVQYVPVLAEVEDECTSFGWEAHDYIGRARRLLDNAVPKALEHEFEQGLMAQAQSLPNNYLTNTSSVTDLTPGAGPPSVQRGQQILEDALAGCGFGGQGMLHVQPQTAPSLLNARRVTSGQGDQLLLSVLDNIIVPGVGYSGIGPGNATPAAGTAWIYATDLVATRLGEVMVTPDTVAEAIDRATNHIVFRAQRVMAASFDAACHFAVRVTLES